MNVCVVGSTMVDLVARVPRLPKMGETLAGSAFALGYGGKGGNQAVTAAKLGATVTIVTRVGSDPFGEGALANYRACGVDIAFARRDPVLATGVAPIFVDDAAQNCIVIVPGANAALCADDVAFAASAVERADALVCQLEVPVAAVAAAFAAARRTGAVTIFNPAPAASVPDDLWRLTDVVVPNETEAELLTGIDVSSDAGAERAARALLERGAGAVILTLGRRGSLIVDAGGSRRITPLSVTAVDPTGAGDAYVGTLAVCLGAGLPLFDSALRANAVAALSVTAAGTQTSFPELAAAQAFLEHHQLPPLPVSGRRSQELRT